jgi:hypothetical protein
MRRHSDLRDTRRNLEFSRLFRAVAIFALFVVGAFPALAQQPVWQPPPMAGATSGPSAPMASGLQGLEIIATPYLWLPWTATTLNPRDSRIPSGSGTVGPGTLVDHLTWVPFMGSLEFRDGPVGGLFDFIHAPVKTGITTKDIIFGSGEGGLVITTGTAMFLYRALVLPNQYVDAGLGVRAWGLAGNLTLNGKRRLLPNVTLASGESWADPLIGARYHFNFGNGYGATAYGDVGGFGLGAHIDWQLIGTVDYSYNSWIDLHAGFRSLNFNYSAQRTGLNVNMYGPIIAASLHF